MFSRSASARLLVAASLHGDVSALVDSLASAGVSGPVVG